MMKRISCYIICILLGIFALSCEDQWDKHIGSEGDDKNVSDLSILEYIKDNPEYAEFAALLKRVGADSLLQKGLQYTVWMPTAESLVQIDTLHDSLVKPFVMNHINFNSTYATEFESGMRIKLVTGKPVTMRADTDVPTGYRLQNAGIKKSNLICKDGVIHELDTCLLPALSLYERLEDGSYDTLLVWLKEYDRLEFSLELSTPTGELDESDRVIYDSAYITVNDILEGGDIRDEDELFTIFATSDDVLNARMLTMKDEFEKTRGREPSPDEIAAYREWTIKSLIHNGEIENYGVQDDLYSIQNNLWRCSKQDGVNRTPIECSNGMFYEVNSLYFPVFLMMEPISNDVNSLMDDNKPKIQYGDTLLRTELTNRGETDSRIDIVGTEILQFIGEAGLDVDGNRIYDFDFSISWESYQIIALTDSDSIAPAPVMPGEYEVYVSYAKYSKWTTDDIRVYVNGEEVGEIIGIAQKINGSKHENSFIGIVTIPKDRETDTVEFKFEVIPETTTREEHLMAPYHIELRPTDNNY